MSINDDLIRKLEMVPELERQALVIVARDESFKLKWLGRLRPEHFNEIHLQTMFRIIEKYVKTYKTLPTIEMIYQGLKQTLSAYDNYQNFATYAYELFTASFKESEKAVKDLLMEHMQRVDYDEFVTFTATCVAEREYVKIGQGLEKIKTRHTMTKPVTPYHLNAEDSIVERTKLEQSQKKAISTPWPTFNNRHGGGFHASTLVAFMGSTGCHARGQGIMMADGSVKAVEDVVVGDTLMGDGDFKTVLKLCRGKGQMYRISADNFGPIVVNEDHILSLIKIHCDQSENLFDQIIDISVREYISNINIKNDYGTFRFHPQTGQIYDLPTSSAVVEPIGTDFYYGFTLTGNGRYLLDDFTVTHNSGKSINLVNVGTHCVLHGLNVYHFTFELSEAKTKARYDVCLTGCSGAERLANPQRLDDALAAMSSKMGKLFVVQSPTGTCSANQVRGSLDEYAMLGYPKPDIIILDYITIMSPNNPDVVDMKREYAKLKVIAEECRAIAMELDIPIVTALQSNRGAAGKEKQGKEDIADSYAVMHILDCVLSINQTDEEKAAGKIRLYAAKVRDFEDSYTIAMNVDYTNLRISEDAVTTNNYNASITKMKEAALAQSKVAGMHPALPDAVVNPESDAASIAVITGFGQNPVKLKNQYQATTADIATANAWGHGLQPPPIAKPE